MEFRSETCTSLKIVEITLYRMYSTMNLKHDSIYSLKLL
jgi:hypothetical protein